LYAHCFVFLKIFNIYDTKHRFVDLKANACSASAAAARLLPLLLRASTSTTSVLDDDEDHNDNRVDHEDISRVERTSSSSEALGRAVVVISSEGRAVAMSALVKVNTVLLIRFVIASSC